MLLFSDVVSEKSNYSSHNPEIYCVPPINFVLIRKGGEPILVARFMKNILDIENSLHILMRICLIYNDLFLHMVD